jgi:tetratricopeptide (TPR) repeat protein
MAGKKSYRVFDIEEAHHRFSRAVEMIHAAPGCVDDAFFTDLVINWSLIFFYSADFKGLRDLLERYLPRIEALGDKRRLSLVLSWIAESHYFSGRGEMAKPFLEKAERIAEEIGDAECIAYVSRGFLWLYSYWIPDGKMSDEMVEHYYKLAIEKGELLNDIFILLHAKLCKLIHSFMRSRFAEARFYGSQIMEIGQRFHDNRALSEALWGLGFCNVLEERYEEALENAEQSLRLSPDRLDELCALGVKGGALALMGQVAEGLEIVRKVRDDYIKNQFILPLAGIDMPFGATMVLAGEMGKGVKHIENSIKYWRSLGNYTVPVMAHSYLGEIYLRMAMGEVKPSFGVILKNLWFILRTLPFADKKAHYHLQTVVSKAKEYNMPGYLAKALHGLGVLAGKKKQYDTARSYFAEALKVAETSDLYIAEKIRTALNSVYQSNLKRK